MQQKFFTGFLTFLLIFSSITVTVAQVSVTKVKSGETASDGVIYNLPLTGFNVEIEVSRTDYIKGPYAEYAEKFLGLTNVIQYDNTVYNISAVSITSFSDVDPDSYFLIQPLFKSKNRSDLSITLTPEGFLSGVTTLENQAGSAKEKRLSGVVNYLPEIVSANYLEKVDTITRRIGRDTMLIEEKILKKSSTAKTPEQRAKEAADFIMKLDESMFNLINGYQEVNYEKGTMEFMYQQMSSMREDYLLQFKGITQTSVEKYSFRIIPDAGKKLADYQIARFSNVKGILGKDVNSGDKISISVEDLNQVPIIYNKKEQENEAASGIVYRLPDMAELILKIGGKELLKTQFSVAQLGELKVLPAELSGELEIHDNTGSLKRVSFR